MFQRLALRAEHLIAHPAHFTAFLAITALWLPWAASRGFDAISQLSVNTPTTLAEYAFAILTLAAARAAAASSHRTEERMDAEIAEVLADMRQVLAAIEAQHSAG